VLKEPVVAAEPDFRRRESDLAHLQRVSRLMGDVTGARSSYAQTTVRDLPTLMSGRALGCRRQREVRHRAIGQACWPRHQAARSAFEHGRDRMPFHLFRIHAGRWLCAGLMSRQKVRTVPSSGVQRWAV
jgi:hypothetical protein